MYKSILKFKINNLFKILEPRAIRGEVSTIEYRGLDNAVFSPNKTIKSSKVINLPDTEEECLNWFDLVAIQFDDQTEELHLCTNITIDHLNSLHLELLENINVDASIRDIATTIVATWGDNINYYKYLKFIPKLKKVSSDTPWEIVSDFDRFKEIYNLYRDTHQNKAKELFLDFYNQIK